MRIKKYKESLVLCGLSFWYAGVAQPVEQLICNQQVGGSNPSTSSTWGSRIVVIPPDCKSGVVMASQVQILPSPPICKHGENLIIGGEPCVKKDKDEFNHVA